MGGCVWCCQICGGSQPLGASPISPRSSSDPPKYLRPHPWSSPLNDRHFDEAIAGAWAAYDAGDYDRAIALNNEALEIHPSPDLVWLLLTRRGDCYLEKNEPNKAIADYDAAARFGELNSHSYVARALAWWREGKREKAMKDFEAAIAKNPDDTSIYLNRATAFADDGDLDLALADYAKALELSPKNVNARLAYAELYVRRKENLEAITQAMIALQIDRRSSRAYVVRAKAYAQMSRKFSALADLDTATKLAPGDRATALNNVAWCRATCRQNVNINELCERSLPVKRPPYKSGKEG